jgi:hypothetical protein
MNASAAFVKNFVQIDFDWILKFQMLKYGYVSACQYFAPFDQALEGATSVVSKHLDHFKNINHATNFLDTIRTSCSHICVDFGYDADFSASAQANQEDTVEVQTSSS